MRFRPRQVVAIIIATTLAASGPSQTPPQQGLLAADAAIRQISANDPEAKIELAEKALANHLRSFCDRNPNEPPVKVAQEWLALVNEAAALPRRSIEGGLGGFPMQPAGTLVNVLITLPPPEVWPEIQRLVTQQSPSANRTALMILCARLLGDDSQVITLCKEYDEQAAASHSGLELTGAVRRAALRRLGKLTDPKDFLAVKNLFSRLRILCRMSWRRQSLFNCFKATGNCFQLAISKTENWQCGLR